MRRYAGAAPGAGMDRRSLESGLADLEAGEALHDHPLLKPGRGLVHEVLHLGLARCVLDERLLQQTGLGVVLLELALDDLVDDLRRLLLVRHLLQVDLPLLLDHAPRYLLARDIQRVAGRHLHRDVLHELLEVVGTSDEVGLAVDLDEHTDLAVGVDVRGDDAVARLAVRLLRRVGEPFFSQVLDRGLELPLAGIERCLAVHHPRSGQLPELLHQFRGRGHGRRISSGYEPASTDSCISASVTTGRSGDAASSAASASSFAKLPAPSRIASAMRAVMRRTARMASSLPGTG